jgi:glycogen(starch) synthase
MVSWEFPPQPAGGLGRHVGMLCAALTEAGHDVRLICHPSAREAELDQYDLLARVEAGNERLARLGAAALDGWRPDVVHGHDWLAWPASRVLAEQAGRPSAVTVHATEFGRQQGWLAGTVAPLIHARERRMCAEAGAVLVCSHYMAVEVGTLFGLGPGAMTVVGNGARRYPVPATPRDPDLVAFAGRLVHEKGLQELIKALPLLRAEFGGIHAVIAGDGPLLAAQRDRAERYRVADRIEWAGPLDEGALARLLARAAVVVVPSLYEPFGLVALEAQLAGTPVAVADTGGLRELVADGVSGTRFAPQSPAAIAAALRGVLGDPERAAAMARTAQHTAQTRFSWAAVAARTAAAYARLTAA